MYKNTTWRRLFAFPLYTQVDTQFYIKVKITTAIKHWCSFSFSQQYTVTSLMRCPLLPQQEKEIQSFWASVNSKWIEVSKASALQPGIQPLGKRSFSYKEKAELIPATRHIPSLNQKPPTWQPRLQSPDQALDSNPALQQGYQPSQKN